MSVHSVKESYEGSGSTTRVDLMSLQVSGDDIRYFDVLFTKTPGETAPERRILAKTAEDPNTHLKIPLPWEQHPADPWLFVTSISSQQVPRAAFLYRVAVRYVSVGNPLELEPVREWRFAVSNEPIDRDVNGVPLTNSSGESFDPPITKEVHDLVLKYKRNQALFDPLIAATYKGAVNNDIWLTPGASWECAPGYAKCMVFTALEKRAAELLYFEVNLEIRFRLDELIVGETDWSASALGWKRKYVDQGFRTLKLVDDVWEGEYEPILDAEGNPVREPQLLDGKGQVYKEEDDPGEDEHGDAEHNRFKGTFLVWDLDKKMPFTDLVLT